MFLEKKKILTLSQMNQITWQSITAFLAKILKTFKYCVYLISIRFVRTVP